MVFRVSIALVLLLVLLAGIAPGPFNTVVQSILGELIRGIGWLYLLVVFLALVFLMYLAFGRFGNLRIGGEDAEPEFSRASWMSMLFAAGMGIGLVFWGAAEPISHFSKPPEGLAPQSLDAARASMRYAFFHWGLHPWAIYALIGLAMAWFQFNRNGSGLVSDMLQPIIYAIIAAGSVAWSTSLQWSPPRSVSRRRWASAPSRSPPASSACSACRLPSRCR